jgi:ribosomal protein S27E
MPETLIGYLIPSGDFFKVDCLDCATDRRIPLFDVNVRPYRQSCRACGRLLVGHGQPLSVPILFDGKKC